MSWRYYNWYVGRALDAAVAEASTGLAQGTVVDLGCGTQPYRALFAGASRYLGVDRPGMPDSGEVVDVFGDAEDIPLAASRADVVVCTEVMEHIGDPRRMLADIHRVLRPGGALVLSVPFIWHIHDEPHDYWRFTEYGLRRILGDAGFTVESLVPVNGFAGAVLAERCYMILFGLGHSGLLRALGRFPIWALQRVAGAIGRFDRNKRATSNYVVRARKPS